jgi:hypothetical protein
MSLLLLRRRVYSLTSTHAIIIIVTKMHVTSGIFHARIRRSIPSSLRFNLYVIFLLFLMPKFIMISVFKILQLSHLSNESELQNRKFTTLFKTRKLDKMMNVGQMCDYNGPVIHVSPGDRACSPLGTKIFC